MKTKIAAIIVALLTVVTSAVIYIKMTDKPVITVDKSIICSIGGENIKKEEFLTWKRYAKIKSISDTNVETAIGDDEKNEELVNNTTIDILKSFIAVENVAEHRGVGIDDDDVDKQLDMIKNNIGNDEVDYEELIGRAGGNEDILVKLIRNELLFNAIKEDIETDEPNDEEVEAFFEANRQEFANKAGIKAYQIVIGEKAKAEEVHKKALSGMNFMELAMAYSENPSKKEGGFIGIINADSKEAMPELKEIILKMPENTVYDKVVETDSGFHIIMTGGKITEEQLELSNIENDVKRMLIADMKTASAKILVEEEKNKLAVIIY